MDGEEEDILGSYDEGDSSSLDDGIGVEDSHDVFRRSME